MTKNTASGELKISKNCDGTDNAFFELSSILEGITEKG
jgi:hypothetical protein